MPTFGLTLDCYLAPMCEKQCASIRTPPSLKLHPAHMK